MKKHYLKMLFGIVGIAGLGVAAQAETRGEIKVNVPFEFTASGETLPAGTYTVSRVSDDKLAALLLTNRDTHVSVFVRPLAVENARADMPNVSFERVGETRFLSRIETPYDIYTIPVSRAAVMEAQMKQPSGSSASPASGSN
jgi:hypothetical protein